MRIVTVFVVMHRIFYPVLLLSCNNLTVLIKRRPGRPT